MGSTVAASVIMTVYNGGSFLSASIESIRKQTVTDLEFVIVNDGSTDSTADTLAQAQKDPRIKVIASKRLGRARALNLAWKNTTGEFIANLDADDLAEPNRIEKQLSFLRANPGVGLLGTAWNFFVGDDDRNVKIFRFPLTNSELQSALIRYYPFCHSATMFSRRALQRVNGYNENYRVCLDYEISARIACQYEVANLPDVLAWKRSLATSFFGKISGWERYRAVVKIRWVAWSAFSRRVTELPYVFNGWSIFKQSVGKHVHQFRSRFVQPGTVSSQMKLTQGGTPSKQSEPHQLS
jgi:glycosyltransferase involved in cell wall biosynthesis